MSTRQKYAGKGNFVPSPAKKAKKSPPAARSADDQRPARLSKSTTSAQPSRRWENSPLERLSELLAIKGTAPGASVNLSGNSIRVKQRGLVSVDNSNPASHG